MIVTNLEREVFSALIREICLRGWKYGTPPEAPKGFEGSWRAVQRAIYDAGVTVGEAAGVGAGVSAKVSRGRPRAVRMRSRPS